ncbi:unknown [Mycoplasma sp. CAG:956]|nr:unknown [Mycoplasma sp. CAG:956]
MDNRHINKLSWAYSTQHYWTMSPSGFAEANNIAFEWYQSSAGNLTNGWYVAGLYGARPVINLKSDVKISGGIGTSNDPFIIDTNK